jgi:hypothetical protein
MIAAGAAPEEAEIAVDRIYQEEEQRMEAEQKYLDWLKGWNPKRSETTANHQQPEPLR